MRLLSLVVLASACAAPTTVAPLVLGSPVVEDQSCRVARLHAFEVRRTTTVNSSTLGDATADSFVCVESHDFNGDGVNDFYVALPLSTVFYLFVQQTPALYVGQVTNERMFDLSCNSERVNGMCVVATSLRMVHGETLYTNYAFNGQLYEKRDHWYSEPER